jgi:rod shape-determining protein MreC
VYRKQVRRRRAILAVLVIISLVLLSTSFSEAQSGPLHSIQSGVSAVFGPIEEGASRALKPIRDLINWFDETFDARGENDQLHTEVDQLRQQLANTDGALAENAQLRKMLKLDQSGTLAGYSPVSARVIARSPTVWYSTVQLDHGSSSGVAVNDPVVTGDGLIGRVSGVTSGTCEVTLITDHRSAVSAQVQPSGPLGVVKTEVGNPTDLLLDFIQNDSTVKVGSTIVTSGTTASQLESFYPPDIPVGTVVEAQAGEQEIYQRIHVKPFADLRGFEYAQVLTGGPQVTP